MNDPWKLLATGARWIVGLVFVISGVHKAAAPAAEFAAVIEGYNLVQPGLVMPLASFLPWVEALLGAALLAGYWTRQAAAGAGAFLLLFIGALASTKIRGLELSNCGCFGEWIHLTPLQAMSMDATLALLSWTVFRRPKTWLALDNGVEAGSPR
jgi:uncharacterized membrane protein YphA (DoxX/SURF4 family)